MPTEHTMQAWTLAPPSFRLCVPAEQGICVALSLGQNAPTEHTMQASTLAPPSFGLCVPAGQGIGISVAAVGQ